AALAPMVPGRRGPRLGARRAAQAAALAACCGLTVLRLGNWLGGLVQAAVESADRDVLGVDVLVGDAWVDPVFGVGRVEGLQVLNPAGFSSDHLLRTGRLVLDMWAEKSAQRGDPSPSPRPSSPLLS
ncbi:unnamed protein product, partial [Prorocentrum cordatum]